MDQFSTFFKTMTDFEAPWGWQAELCKNTNVNNLLIKIPTGFGKTLGILSVWLWHRIIKKDDRWPRRLVWCLPMRVLVEQTEIEITNALIKLGLLWDNNNDRDGKVGVHVLMGGVNSGNWHLYPEEFAVLIGTQDMLLSRALNRGYASGRAKWPMEFGLLNQDCLWVMDEVQLMDIGLATSGQLQAFRTSDHISGRSLRPVYTWWMSATLQKDWITNSPETQSLFSNIALSQIDANDRKGHLWDDTFKPQQIKNIKCNSKAIAKMVLDEHESFGNGLKGLTLVVVNTVERAVDVYKEIKKLLQAKKSKTDLRLVHSRFRLYEKKKWKDDFLNKEQCQPGTDRIIISTQVIEAGVNISAAVLITELAPWTSLVQRFGRCARWGGKAYVIVLDFDHKDDNASAPYKKAELDEARKALKCIDDVAPFFLESFEDNNPELLPSLYPYEVRHLLLHHEINELFDTASDLSGADIDISRFIRSGDEKDVQIFWASVTDALPQKDAQPLSESLCAVQFKKVQNWLCGEESSSKKSPRLKDKMKAWVWDWLDGDWRLIDRKDIYPGQTILVDSCCGGYNPETGWGPDYKDRVIPLEVFPSTSTERADYSQSDESLSIYDWKTITTHGAEVGALAIKIAGELVPGYKEIFNLAGRVHDVGKAHEAFQCSLKNIAEKPKDVLLAKAPDWAWRSGKQLYRMKDGSHRPGFRHELASVLFLFSVLRTHDPDHSALLGEWRNLLINAGFTIPLFQKDNQPDESNKVKKELASLTSDQFNLLAYLVCSHHGKVRVSWHSSPDDQANEVKGLVVRGLSDGDEIPAITLTAFDNTFHEIEKSRLDLAAASVGLNPITGQGWTERVIELMDKYGPFTLSWFEAIFRAADQRASMMATLDPVINKEAF